jgi:NAD+ synthase (glutamine-hydrolysing)
MRYIEKRQSIAEIIAAGFSREMVEETIRRIRLNEYKRRQAPPGIRITPLAFDRDWRFPITHHYKESV